MDVCLVIPSKSTCGQPEWMAQARSRTGDGAQSPTQDRGRHGQTVSPSAPPRDRPGKQTGGMPETGTNTISDRTPGTLND